MTENINNIKFITIFSYKNKKVLSSILYVKIYYIEIAHFREIHIEKNSYHFYF